MDAERFDRITRHLARSTNRRRVTLGFAGGIAAVLTALRRDAAARPNSIPRGGACLRDRQCINDYIPPRGAGLNPDLQIVYCADNGFAYDGEFNCCRYEGGFCDRDEECCGYRSCINRFCGFPEWAYREQERDAAFVRQVPAADLGSVEVLARECPVGYGRAPGDSAEGFAADCLDPLSGVTFVLAGPEATTTEQTDGSGYLRIDALAPGDYVLTNDIRDASARFQVFCVNATLGGEATTAGNRFDILMTAGAQVACQWYVIPAADTDARTGSITLSVYACPTATSPLPDCAVRPVEGEIAIEGPDGIWLDRSNADVSQRGDRRWDGLPPGTYNLAANLLTIEDGDYAIARVDGVDDYFEGVATIVLDPSRPDVVVEVVFAPGGPVPVD